MDRIISAYFQYIKYGSLLCFWFEEGMQNILNGDYKAKYPRSNEILEYGFYYRYLRLYFQYFNKKNILILFHEDIVQDPVKNIRLVYDFLDIKNDFIAPSINTRPQRELCIVYQD